MKALVVGGGLIGTERILAIDAISKSVPGAVSLAGVVEPFEIRRTEIEQKFGAKTFATLDDALETAPEWVFVCTPHEAVKGELEKIFPTGANVLVEKPLGRNLAECDAILDLKHSEQKLHVGFNYRFFEGVEAALKDAREGLFGQIISVNMILGHGNAPGMEKSWKLDPVKCGGGCLIDPGVHMLDLALLLSGGNVYDIGGFQWSGFWNTGIEEEAHMCLRDGAGSIFNIQLSLNRWRSQFRLEINGTEGYGVVEGRGRSYGPQTYKTGKRWGWQGGKSQVESETIVVNGDPACNSFLKETASLFGEDIASKALGKRMSSHVCDDMEAKKVMELLDDVRAALKIAPIEF